MRGHLVLRVFFFFDKILMTPPAGITEAKRESDVLEDLRGAGWLGATIVVGHVGGPAQSTAPVCGRFPATIGPEPS